MLKGLIRLWRQYRNPPRRKECKRDAGFTLVEILVVITILGVLAAVVTPTVIGRIDQARQTKAQIEIRTFADALERYAIDTGDYPTTEQGLEALVIEPDGVDGWRGPYLSGMLRSQNELKPDPWGNPYVYTYPGEHEDLGIAFDIISYGKDGKEGGEGVNADITNWGEIGQTQ